MKTKLLFCTAYWAERLLDWGLVNVNRFDVWLEKQKVEQIEKSRSQFERQFKTDSFQEKEL